MLTRNTCVTRQARFLRTTCRIRRTRRVKCVNSLLIIGVDVNYASHLVIVVNRCTTRGRRVRRHITPPTNHFRRGFVARTIFTRTTQLSLIRGALRQAFNGRLIVLGVGGLGSVIQWLSLLFSYRLRGVHFRGIRHTFLYLQHCSASGQPSVQVYRRRNLSQHFINLHANSLINLIRTGCANHTNVILNFPLKFILTRRTRRWGGFFHRTSLAFSSFSEVFRCLEGYFRRHTC